MKFNLDALERNGPPSEKVRAKLHGYRRHLMDRAKGTEKAILQIDRILAMKDPTSADLDEVSGFRFRWRTPDR